MPDPWDTPPPPPAPEAPWAPSDDDAPPDPHGGGLPAHLTPSDAEQGVLGAAMLSARALDELQTLIPSGAAFYRPDHETIWTAITALYERGAGVDAITVADELTRTNAWRAVGGGAPYLHTLLATTPTATNAAFYARTVLDAWELRQVNSAATRIRALVLAPDGGNPAAIVEAAEEELAAARSSRTATGRARPVAETYTALLEQLRDPDPPQAGVTYGWADLDQTMLPMLPGQLIVVAGRPATGKALALDTPLPTPTGWTTMGAVQPGDTLLGPDGDPVRVLAATDVMHDRPCYRVTFTGGATLVADADHLWETQTRAQRRAAHPSRSVRTTKELAETLRCITADARLNHSVRLPAPLDLPDADLPIGPYTLGAWLGDGTSAAAVITSADPEVIEHIAAEGYATWATGAHLRYRIDAPRPPAPNRTCIGCGRSFRPTIAAAAACSKACAARTRGVSRPFGTCPSCGGPATSARQCRTCWTASGSFTARLRAAGVLDNKHIPALYQRASTVQRRALLAGLLDTDGTVATGGAVEFTATNPRLAEGVAELASGLGMRASVRAKPVKGRHEHTSTAYTVSFTTSDDVFRLTRKRATHRARSRATPRGRERMVEAVDPTPSIPVRCIQVDHPDGMFLAGRSMIPTHNSTVLQNVVEHVAFDLGLPAVLHSWEMDAETVTERMAASQARVPMDLIVRRRAQTYLDKLEWFNSAFEAAPLLIEDDPSGGLASIDRSIRRGVNGSKPVVVAVDYAQLAQVGRGDRRELLEAFTRGLKLLAMHRQVTILLAAQLNRGPETRSDGRPMMSDLRETGSLENDADGVLLVWRPEMRDPTDRPGEAVLIVAKQRKGPTGDVHLANQLHYARFRDLSRVLT